VGLLHPRDAKMLLARTIVRMYHGEAVAIQAEENFKNVFQQGALPAHIPVMLWDGDKTINIIDLLVQLKLQPSKSEARKMTQNGGIRINGEKVKDIHDAVHVTDGLIIQVGKRKFIKLQAGEV
jgi:tyrosyl-tRNA synthetase